MRAPNTPFTAFNKLALGVGPAAQASDVASYPAGSFAAAAADGAAPTPERKPAVRVGDDSAYPPVAAEPRPQAPRVVRTPAVFRGA